MTRRILAVCIALVLAFCSGCGSAETARRGPETEPTVIGLSQLGAESDWRVANSESMKGIFTEENGYRLIFEDARQKQENQITSLRRFIQQKVDYIILMPVIETGWESILQEAKDAGIPVILVDRKADVSDESLYTVHIGSDFYQEGELAVERLESDPGLSGKETVNIVHIQGTLGSTAQLGRTAALEFGLERNRSWNLLAQLDGGFTEAKSYEVMLEFLTGGEEMPEIDVVYCENDNEAFGAIQALEECGYTCDWQNGVRVVTFDAVRNALELCLAGKISVAVECNPLLGPLVDQAIEQLEAGETLPKHMYIEEQVFTPDMLTEEILAQREY